MQAAIAFFAKHGFDASTRELARDIGVTQPLLYRYFPTKSSLVDRVYDEVFVRRWNHAGLSRAGINQRYLNRLRDRHFLLIARELRHSYAIPEPIGAEQEEEEIELIWSVHSSVFYLGVRKWVYDLPTPKNLDRLIDMRVDAFVAGVPAVLTASRA